MMLVANLPRERVEQVLPNCPTDWPGPIRGIVACACAAEARQVRRGEAMEERGNVGKVMEERRWRRGDVGEAM